MTAIMHNRSYWCNSVHGRRPPGKNSHMPNDNLLRRMADLYPDIPRENLEQALATLLGEITLALAQGAVLELPGLTLARTQAAQEAAAPKSRRRPDSNRQALPVAEPATI